MCASREQIRAWQDERSGETGAAMFMSMFPIIGT